MPLEWVVVGDAADFSLNPRPGAIFSLTYELTSDE